MASMRWTNEWLNSNDAHKEYLFLMEKTTPRMLVSNKQTVFDTSVLKASEPAVAEV